MSQNKTEDQYNAIDWFKKCLSNYANFSGRARRKEYWYFVLIQFVVLIIAVILTVCVVFDHCISTDRAFNFSCSSPFT